MGVSRRSGGAEHGLFAGDVPELGDGVGLHEFVVGLLGEDRLSGLREPVLLDEHGPVHAHGRVGVREHADDAGAAFDPSFAKQVSRFSRVFFGFGLLRAFSLFSPVVRRCSCLRSVSLALLRIKMDGVASA